MSAKDQVTCTACKIIRTTDSSNLCNCGHTTLLTELIYGDDPISPEKVRTLTRYNVNAGTPNAKLTALHIAAERGAPDIVAILLEAKADPNRQTTPYMVQYSSVIESAYFSSLDPKFLENPRLRHNPHVMPTEEADRGRTGAIEQVVRLLLAHKANCLPYQSGPKCTPRWAKIVKLVTSDPAFASYAELPNPDLHDSPAVVIEKKDDQIAGKDDKEIDKKIDRKDDKKADKKDQQNKKEDKTRCPACKQEVSDADRCDCGYNELHLWSRYADAFPKSERYVELVEIAKNRAALNEPAQKTGETALHLAMEFGPAFRTGTLIEAKADVHAVVKQQSNKTVMQCVFRYFHQQIGRVGGGDSTAMAHVTMHFRTKIDQLLQKGLDFPSLDDPLLAYLPRTFWQKLLIPVNLVPFDDTLPATSNAIVKPHCAHCDNNSTTLMRCIKCKAVYYCNRDCQKADWKVHRDNCKADS